MRKVVFLGITAVACANGPAAPAASAPAAPAKSVEPPPVVTPAPPPSALASAEPVAVDAGARPTPPTDAEVAAQVKKLSAFGRGYIGPIGGGPVMPGQDVVIARELTRSTSVEQLTRLLAHENPAVRANIAREIGVNRPKDAELVRKLVGDRAPIKVGNMADHPPFVDRMTTVGGIAKETLAVAAESAR